LNRKIISIVTSAIFSKLTVSDTSEPEREVLEVRKTLEAIKIFDPDVFVVVIGAGFNGGIRTRQCVPKFCLEMAKNEKKVAVYNFDPLFNLEVEFIEELKRDHESKNIALHFSFLDYPFIKDFYKVGSEEIEEVLNSYYDEIMAKDKKLIFVFTVSPSHFELIFLPKMLEKFSSMPVSLVFQANNTNAFFIRLGSDRKDSKFSDMKYYFSDPLIDYYHESWQNPIHRITADDLCSVCADGD